MANSRRFWGIQWQARWWIKSTWIVLSIVPRSAVLQFRAFPLCTLTKSLERWPYRFTVFWLLNKSHTTNFNSLITFLHYKRIRDRPNITNNLFSIVVSQRLHTAILRLPNKASLFHPDRFFVGRIPSPVPNCNGRPASRLPPSAASCRTRILRSHLKTALLNEIIRD